MTYKQWPGAGNTGPKREQETTDTQITSYESAAHNPLPVIGPSHRGVADELMVFCPVCGFDYSHHGEVEVFDRPRGEDHPSVILRLGSNVVSPTNANPSDRRGAVRIYFRGECGHNWTLDFIQHKGNTFVDAKVLERCPEPEDRLIREVVQGE